MSIDAKTLAILRENLDFLGYEFLSWLFLHIEKGELEDTDFKAKLGLGPLDFNLHLGKKVNTCLLCHKEQKTLISAPLVEESYEVFASLKNGHLIQNLSLELNIENVKILFTLNAHDFSFSQVKIVNDFDDEEMVEDDKFFSEQDKKREEIFLRVTALEQMESIVFAIFSHFLEQRLSQKVSDENKIVMRQQVIERIKSNVLSNSAPKSEEVFHAPI